MAVRGRIDLKSGAIAAAMFVIIVYGSLYRFELRPYLDPIGPFRSFMEHWNELSRPSDLLANILFYLPFGFFLARCLLWLSAPASIAVSTGAGIGLSFGMEILQYYIAGRHSSISDVYSDAVGAAIGAIAGALSRGWGEAPSRRTWDHFAVLLLASWLGSRLFPYVPVIDLHKYWDALKPLVFAPTVRLTDIYAHLATWLAIALLLEVLFGVARSRLAMGLLFPTVLVARLFIAGLVLSPAEVLGGLTAVMAWSGFVSKLPSRTIVVTILFAANMILQALEPFQFAELGRSFGWVPFRSLMRGSMTVAVVAFLEKVFAYGCLVWLLIRLKWSWAWATALSAALVMSLRLVQIYLPGRSAEVTDVIILLIMAGILWLVPSPSRSSART